MRSSVLQKLDLNAIIAGHEIETNTVAFATGLHHCPFKIKALAVATLQLLLLKINKEMEIHFVSCSGFSCKI